MLLRAAALTLIVGLSLAGQCPESHPNVYYNGEYCCSSDQEKVYAPQGAQCDGSRIQRDSLCCEADSYVPCPSDNCEDYSGDWMPFSVSNSVEVDTDFSDMDIERFFVKLPCEISVWFKLFLRREGGANSHIELYSKVKGNIYCNAAGARNWYDGEKTDFTIDDGAMKCESDGNSIILVVEKTADRVTIKNQGRSLYNQDFTDNDANCRQATDSVKTQVWNYDSSLGLAVFDNSIIDNLAATKSDSCFVNDFDYGQADIKMIRNVDSAKSCLNQCAMQAGCKSMAFVPGNGDCWLKSKLYGDNPQPKVGVISANLLCQGIRVASRCIQRDFDYWGADIQMIPDVDSVMDCADQARKVEGGASVAYQASSRNCWVKYLEKGARPENKEGVDSVSIKCLDKVSIKLVGGKEGLDCLEEGVDFPGADIKNINPIYTIEECEALCFVEDGCVSLTHRPSTQDCWLKNKPNGNGKAFLDTVNSINMNCFTVMAGPEPDCVKENFDFRGADIRMVPNIFSIDVCTALCADEPGCVSVTHQPATSRCWLKNKRFGADPQDMDGVSSRNMQCGDVWCTHINSFLYSYANSPVVKFDSLEEAKEQCKANDACNGITQEPYSGNRYTLRRGPTIHDWSPTAEVSYVLC